MSEAELRDSKEVRELTRTFEEGDLSFTEDQHRDIIKERLQQEKASRFRRWIRSIFHWGVAPPFAPPQLTDEEYVRLGVACEQESLQLLDDGGWKREKAGPRSGDLVETMQHRKYGKIFRLTGVVDCPAEFLFKEMSEGLEQMSQWNPTILECKIVKHIDAETSLTYQVTTGGPKNAVKPRDFVNIRRVSRAGRRMLNSAVSVELPGHPPLDQYIRGHNHVGCWSIEAVTEDDCQRTRFQWLMACDLKGWLPQYVLDIAFSTAQLDFLGYLRTYAETRKAEGAF